MIDEARAMVREGTVGARSTSLSSLDFDATCCTPQARGVSMAPSQVPGLNLFSLFCWGGGMECGRIKYNIESISTFSVKKGPRFGLRQMTTHSLSSPLNHFECPALPVVITQPQAP